MSKLIDLTGQTFGRLTVIERRGNQNAHATWLCSCSCGRMVVVASGSLRHGTTLSCGCLHRDKQTTHGLSKTQLYSVWCSIKDKCKNITHESYINYGGRGISYCKEWEDFLPFYEWAINNGYKKGLTIDRIDVNGDYTPSNCRWVTMQAQQRNKRNNRLITYKGEAHCVSEWAEITGINRNTINSRLRLGYDIEKVLRRN